MISEYKREATRQELIEEIERLKKENEELYMEGNLKVIGAEEYTKANMKEIIEEYYISKEKIENLINSLKNDIVNTKVKIEKEKYIDYIRKARLKAFNTKMNEIICKLQELLEEEK